jgi:RHS repeat-associated protein
VTDGSGLIVSTNSWGTAHSAIGNPYLFTGRQLDEEAGLYFYRARYYDTIKGRFLQHDPDGYRDGWNLYEYVKDSPMNAVDPRGTHVTCTQVSLEFTVIVGGSGCAMYCIDNCGNWGYYGGVSLTAGIAGGGGLTQLNLPGLKYVSDVVGGGFSVQGSVLVFGGSVVFDADGNQVGGGAGASIGKAGISASYGQTFAIYTSGNNKCNDVKPGTRAPCCQCYHAGMENSCLQGEPSNWFKFWSCSGPFYSYKQTTGVCNGTRCK